MRETPLAPFFSSPWGLFPFALSAVCEGVFQGREQMHYTVWPNAPVYFVKVALAFGVLATGHGLYPLIVILFASYVAIATIESLLLLRHVPTPRGRFGLQSALTTAKGTSTFLGIDAVVAVVASLNIILLSKLESERTIGLYSAAAQLLVPLALVYQNSV